MQDWIISALSDEQKSPLNRSAANACILAAAGSGKTRTLVHMILADLESHIPAENIIAFTFTEKAGDELLARVHTLANIHLPAASVEGMYIGTIHGWCLQYLTEQSDFYGFSPIDELHVDSLISRLYDVLELQRIYGLPFPKAIDKFLADVELFYNENLTLKQVPIEIRSCISKFLEILQQNRLITFGGMVRSATKHLQENNSLTSLQSLYVDEYQDVNPAQVSLIRAMLPSNGRVIVVGDDLQCIYQWRGSDVNRILNFSREFNDVSVHRLSVNYRARPGIVEIGNNIAKNIELRDADKVMKPGRDNAHCQVVHWLSLESEEHQVQAITEIVEKNLAEGIPSNKIAILLRSVLKWGQPIVDGLTRRGIPVQCPMLSRGGEFINTFLLPLFEWLRIERKEPKNELEEKEASEAADELWDSVQRWITIKNSRNTFWMGLNKWLIAIEKQTNDAYDVRGRLYDFLDFCGISIKPTDKSLMVGIGIASQIIRSVEEIHRRRIQSQSRRTPRGVLSEVYYALVRKQNDFGESIPIDTTAEGVLITTVHQAKGLEWPIVIIPMLSRRCFPVRARKHQTSFPDGIAQRYGTSIEDERRLFYVAATRARERLFLLDPQNGKQTNRSIFLDELRTKKVINVSTLTKIDKSVWRIDKRDLADPDPPPLRIGLSDLLIYIECPYQFGLRRVASVQPSVGEELGFGKGLHELIQRKFESEHDWNDKELTEQIDTHVYLPYMSQTAEKQSKEAIKKKIRALDDLGLFKREVEPEVSIEVLFDNGIVYGIVDGVQRNEDGSVHVRDWKTNIQEKFIIRYERQLQFYTYALRLHGKVVSKADIVDVGASTEQGKIVAYECDIAYRTLDKLISGVQKTITGIINGEFKASPSVISCACCDMYRLCSERYSHGITK
jgi:DNA helicase-2/ATP-dependent DNA helicase PcrA